MDMITIGDFAGFFASIIATCSMLPQLIKTVRTRSTEGLSLMTLTLSFLGNLGWLINGLAYDSMALVFFWHMFDGDDSPNHFYKS